MSFKIRNTSDYLLSTTPELTHKNEEKNTSQTRNTWEKHTLSSRQQTVGNKQTRGGGSGGSGGFKIKHTDSTNQCDYY